MMVTPLSGSADGFEKLQFWMNDRTRLAKNTCLKRQRVTARIPLFLFHEFYTVIYRGNWFVICDGWQCRIVSFHSVYIRPDPENNDRN